ncbi:MAG: hypothetical protein UX02_C0008G0002 [Candidatus Moranbacteria bacterium GW2011_GWC1_45_18]|nr:MAG: hypothetical protein UT79_C0007G0002 [Candidatus Moranbacteria bacterium GW2011_GWC2_40_12]KKT32257.1 MAG: hypothetical protein UW19_C0026G0002 [Candidatus Moranbacteria bacterium GW2011_GWF2_44_10]KKT70399.1 MAG: hypothetical protein UW66_C0042G0005 [Candidatus Moranbacteria bacterium GW2011_GWF1_44_4]KKT99003.1 MAG: hypothetical protein UX02_C0008G0002 [Candidatus Moranbacteria bacterium GW2011_GWC1_45_18]OGI40154.1 MAG: hypothetical protein A2374_00015 [Candidatus Moranbacteria bacte
MLRKISNKKLIFFLLLFFLAGCSFLIYKFYVSERERSGNEIAAKITTPDGQVLGEEGDTYPNEFKSGKYRVPQLGFGGGLTAFYPGLGEPLGPLEIGNVQSEIVKTKDKKELQLVIKWKTERPTVCLVSYGKSGGAMKTVQEEYFAIEHSAVLEKLDSATTYFYTVSAKDKLGGETVSDKYAVYTGAPEVSFLDLLAGAFKSAFSWAVK